MLNLFDFSLPFKAPLKTGMGEFHHRSGIILHFEDLEINGFSEVSPLPGFSSETLQHVREELVRQRDPLDDFLKSDFSIKKLKNLLDSFSGFPSLQFSLSWLGLLIYCQRNRVTPGETLNIQPAVSLKVNAVIGENDESKIRSQIKTAISEGFSTLKFKSSGNPEKLAKILTRVQHIYPNLTFRLDANRSWPLEKLSDYSFLFRNLPVEYIEEPVRIQNSGELKKVINECSLNVALDESITDINKLGQLLQAKEKLIFIIKPALFGSVFNLCETISKFKTPVSSIVVTTALETSIGRSLVAATASLIGSRHMAHGLCTGLFFQKDLAAGYDCKNGILTIPQQGYWSFSSSHLNPQHLTRIN